MSAFYPTQAGQATTANGSGTARLTLTGLDTTAGVVRICNTGTAVVHFVFGTGTVDAASTDTALGVGFSEIFAVPPGDDVIAFEGSSAVQITVGLLR